ncbi:MAG: polysaccharide deacetylase family protein [Fibrobacter sp.]|nr:polysaccharide deacetylase family protein [Fibrobacter sp.]
MKKNLSFVMAVGWVFSLSLAGLAEAQTVEIGTWAGFRTAAVSFTFDDGPQSDVDIAMPMFEKYGYKATFNIVTNWAGGNINGMLTWSGVKELAAAGHEIASHSESHPEGTMSANEISSSKGKINQNIQQPYGCVTLAYPNCNTPGDAQVLQNYVVGRICNSGSSIMGKNGPSNWAAVPAMMTGSNGTSDFKGNMQTAVQQGGWVAFLTHGFTTGTNGYANYSPTNASAMEDGLQYAKQNDSKIWVAPMGHVAMYIKERNASTATASTSGSSITVKLTHTIANDVSKYEYPLSLRIKNDNNWTAASGTQGGKAITTSIKDGYIYFDAVPNGGDIVISSGGSTPPASSASTPTSSSAAQPASSNSSIGGSVEYKLEMEDYMPGGEGVGYSALNDDSEATGYRSDDAGIVKVGTDGYGVGYTMAGEWYAYSLVIRCEGQFSVVARAATGAANKARFTVSADNVAGEVAVDVPSTPDDWNAYAEVNGSGTLNLVPGDNVIRVHFDDSYINVDWIKLTSSNAQCPEVIPVAKNLRLNSLSGPVQYQVFDINGHLLKSGTVSAQGGVQNLWSTASRGLSKGTYVLRYGNGSSTRSVQVRK